MPMAASRRWTAHFNPRSPHGERPAKIEDAAITNAFQSTLPARGATLFLRFLQNALPISIHAPRTGSDRRPSMH